MQLVVVDVRGVERPGVVGATFGVVICAVPRRMQQSMAQRE
jgi:hypothetical protein